MRYVIIIVNVVVILIGIIFVIIMMFLSWVNCHRKRARSERLLVTVAFFNTLMAGSCLESVHCHKDRARIGCVWDEILVTVDGCSAAMWEKYAQGFGIFGPGRGGGGGGGASAWSYSLAPCSSS